MAARFTLWYWPIPFRGQFIRWVLAHAGADWDEAGGDVRAGLRAAAGSPLTVMAPPVLEDAGAPVVLSQMPAILGYLGREFGLMPGDRVRAALTDMVVANANDVLEEVTLNGGRAMWDGERWEAFSGDRLVRWMAIFEAIGKQHGLGAGHGHLLGGDVPGLADLVTACLWYTMADKLPGIGVLLDRHAPCVAGLSRRLAQTEAIAALRARTDAAYGTVYCGGQIERSLRAVLDGWQVKGRI